MILFVFEGDEREPRLYRTLERLYFPKKNDNIICSFGNNIYDLYNELQEYDGDGDIVALMRERLADRGDATLDGIRNSDISEIFLFFDYDFQNSQLSLEEINRRVEEMLALKRLAREFSAYDSLDHLLFKDGETPAKDKYLKVKDNWEYLRTMNVCKANLLTTGLYTMPRKKSDIGQLAIFSNQVTKYVKPNENVAILNSFPIFISTFTSTWAIVSYRKNS